MPFLRSPEEPSSRLEFKPGQIVLLNFGTEGQEQPMLDEGDLVLNKGAFQVDHPAGIREDQRGIRVNGRGGAVEAIPGESQAETIDDLIDVQQRESMLKIQIKSLSFFLVAKVVPPGFIVIDLERGHVLVGKFMLPAGKRVGPAQIRVAFDHLRIRRI